MRNMEIRFQRLSKEVPIPVYAYESDAAFDLCAQESVTLGTLDRAAISTGLALEIPDGYVGLIWDRSGVSMKQGLKTLGGVVDAGYRGEIKVGMVNVSHDTYEIKKGDKIAQLIIQKREQAIFIESDDLSETQRGEKGFGSSGK